MSTIEVRVDTAYPDNVASARVRVGNHRSRLLEHGISLDYQPSLTNQEHATLASGASVFAKGRALLSAARRARGSRQFDGPDLLMVHRLRFISPLPGYDPPDRLDVYDIDDALHIGTAGEGNRRFSWLKREPKRFRQYVALTRLTIAGNSYLADKVTQLGGTTEVVPSCVDTAAQGVRAHEEVEVPTVGWMGSASTAQYLRPVVESMAQMNSTSTRLRLRVIGGDPGVSAPWIEVQRWSRETEKDALASFDIGVMPIPDTEWAKGKCGYKILQYFSAGVPAIASAVGVNRELVGRERGILVGGDDDWAPALEALACDADARRELGANAREFVEQRYSFNVWSPRLAELLRGLC